MNSTLLLFSCVRPFVTSWTAARQASLSIISQNLLKLLFIKSVDAIQPSHPLWMIDAFSPCLQSFLVSESFSMSQFFASGGQRIGASVSASVLPTNDYSGQISFRNDWFDLLAVQETLRSLLQHHNSKASILPCSAFFKSNSHIYT